MKSGKHSKPNRKSERDKSDEQLVIVIDDDKYTLDLIEKMLFGRFRVITSPNGADGIELIKKSPVDVIILDWMMPGLDGLKVLECLKSEQDTRDVPVLFLTGSSDDEEARNALKSGAVDFIPKPFKKIDLIKKLEDALKTVMGK